MHFIKGPIGQWPAHLVNTVMAWFRQTKSPASTTLKWSGITWTGSRALIDPFPPPPIKKFPAPDMAISSTKITMTMNWDVAPWQMPVKGTAPWVKYGDELSAIGRHDNSVNQHLQNLINALVVLTLLLLALLFALVAGRLIGNVVGYIVGRAIYYLIPSTSHPKHRVLVRFRLARDTDLLPSTPGAVHRLAFFNWEHAFRSPASIVIVAFTPAPNAMSTRCELVLRNALWIGHILAEILVIGWPSQWIKYQFCMPLIAIVAAIGIIAFSKLCILLGFCYSWRTWYLDQYGSTDIPGTEHVQGQTATSTEEPATVSADFSGKDEGPSTKAVVSAEQLCDSKSKVESHHLKKQVPATIGAADSTQSLSQLEFHQKSKPAKRIDASHKDTIDQLKASHQEAIDKLDTEYKSDIKQLEAAHQEDIAKLKVKSAEELKTSETLAESQIALVESQGETIKAEADAKRKLQSQYNDLREEHSKCKPQLSQASTEAETEKTTLRKRAHDADQEVTRLKEQIATLQDTATKSSKAIKDLESKLPAAEAGPSAYIEGKSQGPLRAYDLFHRSFLDGFDILPADSTKGQCGFYAAIQSIKAMSEADPSRKLPVPSLDDLQKTIPTVQQKMEKRFKEFSLLDEAREASKREGYFSTEEICIALNAWSVSKGHNLLVELGIYKQHESCKVSSSGEIIDQIFPPPMMISTEHRDHCEPIIVWLHHNGVEGLLAHYSGMRNHLLPVPKAA
ncbi:MAG: hypothetical protein Q9168_005320 [Polycauliona sp. 1 TL-2023]